MNQCESLKKHIVSKEAHMKHEILLSTKINYIFYYLLCLVEKKSSTLQMQSITISKIIKQIMHTIN